MLLSISTRRSWRGNGMAAAYKGDRIEAAAIEAHFGLHAVYDLHEAYFKHRKITKIALQCRNRVAMTQMSFE